jgi:hypothetical protein
MKTTSHTLRGQRGFSMFLVIMALFVTSMFVAAAFAAANGDLPQSGTSKDRKAAYAAAEAGLNFYLTHLAQDNDYWTKCENVPAPNASEVNPVNRVWTSGADTRRWRKVTGSNARYTLEILPANGFAACDPTNQTSVLDLSTGSFRVRSTGQSASTSKLKRSIVATLRRHGFLDFLYFTYYEDSDPQSLSPQSTRDSAALNCANKFRSQRPAGCPEIQFVTGDKVKGPLHSNDSLLICGSPTFGRTTADKVEVAKQPGNAPPRVANGGGCTDATNVAGVWKPNADTMEPPSSNSQLKAVAQSGGAYYKGKTLIRFVNNNMVVRNKGVTTTVGLPSNGVIYVDADATQGSCQPAQYPVSADYGEDNGCGNAYVSGTYSSSLTIASSNDIIIAPTTSAGTLDWTGLDENLINQSNSVLGLIANNFVRVGHKVNRSGGSCSNFSTAMNNVGLRIDAAILSLQHSFIVDNYSCGAALGNLNVTGAIAQRYRGPVGTSANTGFIKNYEYDDRLRYRSPPFFLNPIDSAWGIVRSNEQVPAR